MPDMAKRMRNRRRAGQALRLAMLSGLALIVLAPMYLTVVNALLPTKYVFAYPPLFAPKEPTLAAFRLAIQRGSMERYFVNSIVVALAVTAGQIVTSSLGAYAFTFLRFPLRRTLFWLVAGSAVVPAEAIIFGNYRTIVGAGWLDSYPALIVPFLASGLGVLLLSRTFRTVPHELLGAAQLDGCGHLRLLRHVVAPVARPSIAALGVLSFLGSWNQYLWPLLVTNRPDRRTLPIGLKSISGGELSAFNALSAAAVLTLIPVLIALAIFNKQLIRGLTAGLAGR
jgi:sn-glycerol 3-phosphate transport system permease protein